MAGGRIRPVLLLTPDRCRVPTSGWPGQGSALADREATRSALEAVARELETCAARGEEKAFVRGCSLLCHRCWVFGVGGVVASLGCGVSRGAGARRVWCVAPSLTLVPEPWRCWLGDMMIDRVSPRRGAAAAFFEGRHPEGCDRLTAGSRPRSHQVWMGVSIASVSFRIRPPRRPCRRARAGCDASGGRSYGRPRWRPVCGRCGP